MTLIPKPIIFPVCFIALWIGHLTAASAVPANPYNIVSFGAVPDGKTINTTSIQAAIDKCHQDGSGKVLVPPGNFLTGSIHLLGNVQLYLDTGAVLTGSTQTSDYPDNGYVAAPTSVQLKRPH